MGSPGRTVRVPGLVDGPERDAGVQTEAAGSPAGRLVAWALSKHRVECLEHSIPAKPS